MPHIDEFLNELRGAEYFARLDLVSAYNQLGLSDQCWYVTIFITDQGLYRFQKVCFGLASAAVLQKIMRVFLKDLSGVKFYLGDIVYGSSGTE